MIALGWTIGPPIGGLLFTVGGFRLPFMFLGVAPLCFVPALLVLFPVGVGAAGLTPRSTGTQQQQAQKGAQKATESANTATTQQEGHQSSTDDREDPATIGGVGRRPYRTMLWELPLDVGIVAGTAFMYTSKWGWWDIQFTGVCLRVPPRCSTRVVRTHRRCVAVWMVSEFDASIQAASLYMAFLAATFTVVVPCSGRLGDRLGDRRLELIAAALMLLAGLYMAMGPWQLMVLSVSTRQMMLIPYLLLEGVVCTLLEPTFLPLMMNLAESQRGRADEHLTNFMTSLGQTCLNAGQVFGPFLGAFIIEHSGFRGALVAWAVPFAGVALWMGRRLGCSRVVCNRNLQADTKRQYTALATSESE
jgi:MFS family permease